MSLYDDCDVKTRATSENVSGWSSGIKLLQSQLQLKKATVTQPKRDHQRKVSLPPVIDLKNKRGGGGGGDDDDPTNIYPTLAKLKTEVAVPTIHHSTLNYGVEYDWHVDDEYDPLWPNEFDKVVKELRENRDRENDKEEKLRERRKKSRFNGPDDLDGSLNVPQTMSSSSSPPQSSGFAGLWQQDDEIEAANSVQIVRTSKSRSSMGAAIAPPASLQDIVELPVSSSPAIVISGTPSDNNSNSGNSGRGGQSKNFGSSVAAKIMARYGFKEGQGLGKKEQGMSSALQVEKTSKRGGRIIHEKELLAASSSSSLSPSVIDRNSSPPNNTGIPSITEIIKNPSKVVLLKNMVGPGEVDDDLEPEVKDECNTKYGEVGSVIIHETHSEDPEEGVRIFVEFRRIESAIKAVVDLNGRFFGGRQVKANFYDPEKYDNLQLMD